MSTSTQTPATPIGGGGAPQPPTLVPADPISMGGGGTPPTTGLAQPIGGLEAVAPSISSQPPSRTVTQGLPATMALIAAGTPPLSYQWYKDTNPLTDDAVTAGTHTNSLTFINAQTGQAGTYHCVVTNAYGEAISDNAFLTVNTSAGLPPTIFSQPQSKNAPVGASASFTCLANGSSPFTYQWFRNDVAMVGQTSNFLTINNIQPADAADYNVIVTNPYGTATSNKAHLTIITAQTLPVYLGNGGTTAPGREGEPEPQAGSTYTAAELKALVQVFPQVNPVNRSAAQGTYEISAPSPPTNNEYRVLAFPASFVPGALTFTSAGANLPMTQLADTIVDGINYKVYRTVSRSAGDFTIAGQTAINVT